jgi:hypothetical protein
VTWGIAAELQASQHLDSTERALQALGRVLAPPCYLVEVPGGWRAYWQFSPGDAPPDPALPEALGRVLEARWVHWVAEMPEPRALDADQGRLKGIHPEFHLPAADLLALTRVTARTCRQALTTDPPGRKQAQRECYVALGGLGVSRPTLALLWKVLPFGDGRQQRPHYPRRLFNAEYYPWGVTVEQFIEAVLEEISRAYNEYGMTAFVWQLRSPGILFVQTSAAYAWWRTTEPHAPPLRKVFRDLRRKSWWLPKARQLGTYPDRAECQGIDLLEAKKALTVPETIWEIPFRTPRPRGQGYLDD